MANVEDDAEFGSHFLDSMLEVEMTEEDGELDVTKNENFTGENARTLPPIPTFDLQSETLTYKDVYRSSAVQPPLTSTPDRLPSSGSLPKSSPMLTIYSRDLLSTSPSSTSAKVNPPKICPKASIKPKTFTKVIPFSEEILATQFLQQVFRPEYIKNVFVKKDTPLDMSQTSEEEMEYYKTCFKDLSKIRYCRLHCTICDKHLGCGVNVEKKLTVHSMLKVLTCKTCFEFYGDGNFPCDKGDNCEIYCRWCGQGGALVCCSFCPRVFCKKCVKRNFGPGFLRSIEKASDWACFCCAQKPLWPHRAICRALMEYIVLRKSDSKILQKDITKCCIGSVIDKKKIKPLDKNKIMFPQGEVKISAGSKNVTHSNLKNKSILPVKTNSRKEQSILKSNLQIRLSDQNKNITPVKLLNKNTVPKLATNILSSRSLLTRTNVVQNISVSDKIRKLSTFSSPQLIQRPVLHGETIITPPGSRMLMTQKAVSNPSLGNSFVRVSLTNQTSNLDISKIPTAKIPHDVQGLILRMSFPDKKVQLVRLVSDGNECKTTKDFPMPDFKKSDELTFVEENLADTFKLSKMIYDQLMVIREKVNSRSKFTENGVFTSSVKKLHFIYEKSIELLKGLDQSLLDNFEQWKNQMRNPLDVIDLSDEEGKAMPEKINKHTREPSSIKKGKESLQKDDSDIEILDQVTPSILNSYDNKCDKNKSRVDSNSMNSDSYQSSMAKNFKEKYRLRDSLVERLKEKSITSKKKKTGRKVRKKRKVNILKNKVKNHEGKNESQVKSINKIEEITVSRSEVEKSSEEKSFDQGSSSTNTYRHTTDTSSCLKVSQENMSEETFQNC